MTGATNFDATADAGPQRELKVEEILRSLREIQETVTANRRTGPGAIECVRTSKGTRLRVEAMLMKIFPAMPSPDPTGLFRHPSVFGLRWEDTDLLPPEVLAIFLGTGDELVGVLLADGKMLMLTGDRPGEEPAPWSFKDLYRPASFLNVKVI